MHAFTLYGKPFKTAVLLVRKRQTWIVWCDEDDMLIIVKLICDTVSCKQPINKHIGFLNRPFHNSQLFPSEYLSQIINNSDAGFRIKNRL